MRAILAVGLFGVVALGGVANADEKKVHMQDLPPAVQQAIKDHSRGGTVRGISTEVEHGKRVYEAELLLGGRGTDLTFDEQGHVVSLEEETSLDQVPAPARAAFEKAAANGGTLAKIEKITANGAISYEAQIRKDRKTSEVRVDAAGKPVK